VHVTQTPYHTNNNSISQQQLHLSRTFFVAVSRRIGWLDMSPNDARAKQRVQVAPLQAWHQSSAVAVWHEVRSTLSLKNWNEVPITTFPGGE
jgi:hypothetical protein